MTSPVFVAVDTASLTEARLLAQNLNGLVGGLKLGLEFFISNGPAAVTSVSQLGMPVFLDLKLHDIPNTVAGAMRGVVALRPQFVTIHAGGGAEMMRAAVATARDESVRLGVTDLKVLAVTVLTSLDQEAVAEIGVNGSVADQVRRLAVLAKRSGVDGLVCSPHEVATLRSELGADMTLVVPGIRPSWAAAAGDQKRIMTPSQAVAQGADVLVIGRPIVAAADPVVAARKIADELGR